MAIYYSLSYKYEKAYLFLAADFGIGRYCVSQELENAAGSWFTAPLAFGDGVGERLGAKQTCPLKNGRAESLSFSLRSCRPASRWGWMWLGRRWWRSSRNDPTPHPLTNGQGFWEGAGSATSKASNPSSKELPP